MQPTTAEMIKFKKCNSQTYNNKYEDYHVGILELLENSMGQNHVHN